LPDKDSTDNGGTFERPWEDSEDQDAEVVQLPGMDVDTEDVEEVDDLEVKEVAATGAVEEVIDTGATEDDAIDWDSVAERGDEFDAFTSEEYLTATTKEYRGLADDVSKAAEEEWQMQAVAAAVPGVESGLVGFEDVSGRASESEESFEAVEQAHSSDLTMRIASALVIFGLFVGSLILGGWWFSAFLILVMLVAVGELYATVRTIGYQPLALFGIVGVVLVGVGAHNWGAAAIAGWTAGVTVLVLLFFSLTPRNKPLENASITVLGLAWVGMVAFAILVAQGPHPIAYILFVVLLVALNDIGAYFVGRSIGKRKMAPVVSPNKTFEGWVGGLILSLVAAAVMSTIPAWESISLVQGLMAAGVVAVFAPLGDFAESMVKRSIGVKDMGSVLPGHGGMLDRIDGFLFAVPAIYLLFRALELL